MSFYDIRILFIRELRGALREKGILINVLLVPLLLYPALLWTIFSAVSLVRGHEERFVSRIAVVDLPAAHAGLRARLVDDPQVRLDELAAGGEGRGPAQEAEIRDGELDLLVIFHAVPVEGLPSNVEMELVWNSARDRSSKARSRFEQALDEYRGPWLEAEAHNLGVSMADWRRFRTERQNEASSQELGAFVLGLVAPILMIVMVSVGCFYPAVDATAGERERSTWETTLTVAADRHSIVVAKFLYVAALGMVAGLLNLLAMAVSMQAILQPMIGDSVDLSITLPWTAAPLLVIATLLLALFLAAGMMLFAAFARGFKEGQSMVGPFYLLALLPALLVTSPDLELTVGWALVPVANVSLLLRQAILGVWDWPLITLVLLVEVVTISLLLALARWMLGFEEVVMGNHQGSALAFWKSQLGNRVKGGKP